MPNLEALMSPSEFERVSGLMQLKAPLSSGALAGKTSRQTTDCNDFPIAKFTPGDELGEAELTDANIAQSIRNAYAAAKTAGGGRVLIPAGHWHMGDEPLVFNGSGFSPAKPVWIQGAGAGCTILEFPSPFTGIAVHLRGSGSDLDNGAFTFGGLSGLSIFCDASDVGNTGIGVRIDACIYTKLEDLDVRNFVAGKGFECRDFVGGSNSQYVQFFNVRSSSNGKNYDFGDLTNCQAVGMYSGFPYEHDFVFTQNNMLAIYGGFMQGDAAVKILFDGNGGNRIVIQDMYHEGLNPTATVIKMEVPGVSANLLDITRFDLHAEVGTFLDCDAASGVKIDTIYRVTNATKLVKARNGQLIIINCSSPQSLPALFDLDDASARELVCFSNGKHYANTMRLISGLELAPYIDGADAALPDGNITFNTTTQRPRARGDGEGHDLAYLDDPVSLSDLLAPYAEDILDPGVASKRSVIADELASLTGLVNGMSFPAIDSSHRPAFTASDADFGGRATFTCSLSEARFMKGTAAHAIAASSYPALFVIYKTIGATAATPRVAAQVGTIFCVGADDNVGDEEAWGLYDIASAGGASILIGSDGWDLNAHIHYLYTDGLDGGKLHMQLDRNPDALENTLQGSVTPAQSTLYLGSGSGESGSDVTIAYAAFLKVRLPSSVLRRAISLARERFAL